jgi:ligand-binding sensor domain-containing protein
MKRSSVIVLMFLLIFDLQAQLNKFGTPIIKNYSTQVTPGTEQNWWITKDKSGVVYFANDDRGVIRYDGTTWSQIPVRNNSRVRSLDTDKNGIIYVAGAYEFGYIEPDEEGKQVYVSLSKRYDKSTNDTIRQQGAGATGTPGEKSQVYIGEIFSIAVTDSLVFYLSDEALFIYNIDSQELDNINLRNLGFRQFVRIYNINGRIILAENIQGLFEYRNGSIEKLPGGDKFAGMIAITVLPVRDSKVLVGTYNNGIYLYDYNSGEVNDKWVDKKVQKSISQIYCGTKLSSGEFVLGTVGGEGIFILNSNGRLIDRWNSRTTELKDNLVSALFSGTNNDELWIATTGFISKAYTNIPFSKFSEMSGISSSLNGICELNGTIYVSTDEGVLKSFTDQDGVRRFTELKGIGDQVFPLLKVKVGEEEFILASSILELYKISKKGEVTIVKNNEKNTNPDDNPTFAARFILQSNLDPHRFYLGTTNEGIVVVRYQNGGWVRERSIKKVTGNVAFQVELGNGDLIVMTDYPNVLFRLKLNDSVPTPYSSNEGLPKGNVTLLRKLENDVVISTNSGLFKFNEEKNNWMPYNEIFGGFSAGKDINSFYEDSDKDLWLELNDVKYNLMMFSKTDSQIIYFKDQFLLLPNVKMLDLRDIENEVWFTKSKNLFVVNKEKLHINHVKPTTVLTKILVGGDSLIMSGTFFRTLENGRRIPANSYSKASIPQISYNLNSLSFYWATPYYIEEDLMQYSYLLDGFTDEWSKWENIHYKDFTNLPFGKYTFRVKARTATNLESNEAVYEFYVLKPWYLKTIMIILYTIVFIFIIFAIIKAYTRKLKNENIRLEGIVAERTAVVVKQKEELESSIHYASRIQMALLPSEAILSENLKNYFILFKPRDIVSGDFYWMTKKNNRLYIVAADCTGHGVPGAFMSLLGMSFLDEIIDKENSPRADQILSQLRLHVTDSLKQIGGDDEAKDGMDIALLVIDFDVSKIEFSGAYNPCFRVRKMTKEETKNYHNDDMEMPDGSMSNGSYLLETIFASKMPIGISSRMDEDFVFYDWALEKGVSYYLFSDGYLDQFGGPNGRKFMKKNFKKLILDMQEFPMSKQKELFEKNLREWMGQSPQIDDILVMGIRTE